ncbi:hypothetical protein KDA_17190 [Dictyobacter alpinus]|uniref:Uncharacterized protein n=1 Tax=Dictyobacter alpinus TaxID=2014873 RepID=A0A402B4F0_9CHLR|nr:hypothetical protein [Dictyobacter alpinus]GCE26235.1 hypothetical protein KDA_17190 [Dictyobacter alpinus]
MQLYDLLPTAHLSEKETLLQAVMRRVSYFQHYVVTQTPTQKLDGDQSLYAGEQLDYETALMVSSARLSYWEQQPMLR